MADFAALVSRELDHFSLTANNYYRQATVLALSWEEDDLGVIQEIRQLKTLFNDLLNFEFREYAIPSDRPQAALFCVLADFVLKFGEKGNLIVIYYGGHGDPDLDGDKQSVWAAKRIDGPTLRWHLLQDTLENADADVVLLLDCCFAGQAARARSHHRVELLAAATMNLMTPGVAQPGAISFTKALLDLIPRLVHEKTSFTMTELHRELLRRDTGLVQQPLYAALFESSYGGIVIQPLRHELPVVPVVAQNPNDDLVLRVSMSQMPTSTQKVEFLEWLTTARPSTVSAVSIEQTIQDAQSKEACGEYLAEMHPEIEVSPSNRADLISALKMLQEATHSPASASSSTEDICRIRKRVERLCETFTVAFESCMQDMTPKTLESLQRTDSIHNAGYSDLISMRLLCLDDAAVSIKAPAGKIIFPTPPRSGERFRIGKLNDCAVLVDYWDYDSGIEHTSTAANDYLHRVKRMATLHLQLKPAEFCTLPGKGYRRESIPRDRFGMVYALPQSLEGQGHLTLIESYRSARCVPMEVRYRLALKIATAILNFHIIGWLHKGLRSENILLFGTQAHESRSPKWTNVDFTHPFLVGFDYSRPDAEVSELSPDFSLERNLYRHPDRWGRPARFRKEHDIYALGVLLLEIGLWRPVSTLDPSECKFRSCTDPEKVRQVFLKKAGDRLAHAMGWSYAAAAQWCLSYELDGGPGGPEYDQLSVKALRKNVVEMLKQATF
ncbi:hypothetical protein BDW62DRAFT_201412 [Aspergillus aurantiobrunneus]